MSLFATFRPFLGLGPGPSSSSWPEALEATASVEERAPCVVIVEEEERGEKDGRGRRSRPAQPRDDDNDDDDEPCGPVLREMLLRQECFLRRSGRPSSSSFHRPRSDDAASAPSAAGTTRSCDALEGGRGGASSSSSAAAAAAAGPLYNYAYYAGQGFGRVLEHTVSHCLTAARLHRPCVVDVSSRDAYYTWRSFVDADPRFVVEAGELWGETSSYRPEVLAEVEDALGNLTKQAAGHWDDPSIVADYEHVFPMVRSEPKDDRIALWDGTHPVHGAKALLSPNWGTAWFGEVKFPPFFGGAAATAACDKDRLTTLVQNAMYRPGPLARTLHEARKRQIWPTTTGEYGAVHLRTWFLTRDGRGERRDDFQLVDLIAKVDACLSSISDVDAWWLITDDPAIVPSLIAALNDDRRSVPLRVRHGYTPEFVNATEHSMSAASKGPLAHAAMGPSILDWTAIHESNVAVITEGAYGTTAARGRGRVKQVKTKNCDGFGVWKPKVKPLQHRKQMKKKEQQHKQRGGR